MKSNLIRVRLLGAFVTILALGILPACNFMGLHRSQTESASSILVFLEAKAGLGPIDLGKVLVGKSNSRVLHLANTGRVRATSIGVAVISSDFSVSNGPLPDGETACTETLIPGSSCAVLLKFTPSTRTALSASLTVVYFDGTATGKTSIAVGGQGITPASLSFLGADPYDYGTKASGFIYNRIFKITNNGDLSATQITAVNAVSPLSPFPFFNDTYPGTSAADACGTSLAAGATCSLGITFSPPQSGQSTGTMLLLYNDGANASSTAVSKSLKGNAIEPAMVSWQGQVGSQSGVDFGTLPATTPPLTTSQSITLTNTGETQASDFTITIPSTSDFSFTGGVFPGTGGDCAPILAAGKSCQVNVTYAASKVGKTQITPSLNYNPAGETYDGQLSVLAQSPYSLFGEGVKSCSGPGFGSDGTKQIDLNPFDDVGKMALQPDGRILVASLNQNFGMLLRLECDGSVDSSFGQGGSLHFPLVPPPHQFSFGFAAVSGMTVNPNGDIILLTAGSYTENGTTTSGFYLNAYDRKGQSKNIFGTSASVKVDGGEGLTPLSDGKYLLMQTFTSPGGAPVAGLVRTNTDASQDTTFGTNGTAKINFTTSQLKLVKALEQPGGKYLLLANYLASCGSSSVPHAFIARFNNDGTVDTTFGSQGTALLHPGSTCAPYFEESHGLVVHSNGKIGVYGTADVGTNPNNLFFAFLDSNAPPGLYFGTPPVDSSSTLLDAALLPDGSTISFGTDINNTDGKVSLLLAKFTPTGVPDNTFGISGGGHGPISDSIRLYPNPSTGRNMKALLVQPDGRFLVGGVVPKLPPPSNDSDYYLMRFRADGTLDVPSP